MGTEATHSRTISVGRLAETANLSRPYFRRTFKNKNEADA
jgi:transcriptional regulator GlxA family with amidase domain